MLAHCFGAHLSVAGGMSRALHSAAALRMKTVQVFVKNQRQWHAPPLSTAQIDAWHAARLRHADIRPLVAHASYLLNLASASAALRRQSIAALTDELRRCAQLEIDYLVLHPGAAGDQAPGVACLRVAQALNQVLDRLRQTRVMPLLETTAGQGTSLGRSFEELALMLDGASHPVGVCVDTCHVFAAGYDIRDPASYQRMTALAADTIGLERVRCWHVNDSLADLGARVDRHAGIGKGRIGHAGFRNLLADARFAGLPMILETPKGCSPGGRDLDSLNLATLRRLSRRAAETGGTTARSAPTVSRP